MTFTCLLNVIREDWKETTFFLRLRSWSFPVSHANSLGFGFPSQARREPPGRAQLQNIKQQFRFIIAFPFLIGRMLITEAQGLTYHCVNEKMVMVTFCEFIHLH